MSLLHDIRRRLAALVLRGRPLDAWVSRKVRLLERQYQAELVDRSQGKPATLPPRRELKRDPRRILFISDCQWEGEELVPELEAICRVDTLNLHPALGRARGAVPPSEVVRTELAAYLSNHASVHPDVILFYARPNLLSREAFELLRHAYSCPIVGMNLDDKIQFLDYGVFAEKNDNYKKWAGCFDLNLTNVRALVDWYSDEGFPVYYMPEGFHPKAEPLGAHPEYRYEMTFVGSWRAEREQLYRQLQSLRVPIEVFGRGWPNAQECAHPEQVFRASMMTLGIGFASPSKTLTTLKARDFECPGAGTCYLTSYNWELALHYDIGKEILCYRSVEEIVELFSYYRRRPEACWRMAQAAYGRCLNEHTWEKRFRTLFQDTGIAS